MRPVRGATLSGFTKLFESILDSSVWDLDDQTVRVWIAMMALADMDGEVHNTIPGLARRAKVSIEACESALVAFMSPDKYSRTKAHDGRRIEEIEEGWRLLNHPKYRRMFSQEEQREKTARRTREWRDREAAAKAPSPTVTDRHRPSPAVTNDDGDDKQRQKHTQKTEQITHQQDLKTSQDRAHEAPPMVVVGDDRETLCPMDLQSRAEQAGVFSELAKVLKVSEAALRLEAEGYAGYWTVGEGAGRKRRNWMGRLRQRLVDRAKAGELPRVDPTTDPALRAQAERRAEAMKAADEKKIAELNEQAAKYAGATVVDLGKILERIGNCRGCGKTPAEVKFRGEPRNRDGLMARCVPCDNERSRAWAAANPSRRKEIANRYASKAYKANPAKFKSIRHRRLAEHPERRAAYNERNKIRQQKKRKEMTLEQLQERERARRADPSQKAKIAARDKLRVYVRRGKVVRLACEVCGDPNTHGHHDDYSKPLDVRWLCPTHHGEVHRGSR